MDIAELNRLAKKDKSTSFGEGVVAAGFVAILAMVFLVPIMVYSIWAYAFVGAQLWAWFVVPTFGLATLSLPQAWGISLLAHLWTYQHVTGHKDERETAVKVAEIAGLLVKPWFVYFWGWVAFKFLS